MKKKMGKNRFFNEQIMQEGYRTQQATKPQSLSYAMIDSPVGTAAQMDIRKILFFGQI